MFFSVDFELLGEIKPHDLKPGGADIQVFVLIHPKLLSFLSLSSSILNFYLFIFVFSLSELLSSSSSILNFFFFMTLCSSILNFNLLFFISISFLSWIFQSSLSLFLYLYLGHSNSITGDWGEQGGVLGLGHWVEDDQVSSAELNYFGTWVLGTCYLVLTWYLGLVLGTWYLGLVTKLRMKR